MCALTTNLVVPETTTLAVPSTTPKNPPPTTADSTDVQVKFYATIHIPVARREILKLSRDKSQSIKTLPDLLIAFETNPYLRLRVETERFVILVF